MTEIVSVFRELHSEEVHEIISAPPHWLVNSGITMIFCMVILLGVGSWYVKYPDIVSVPFTLTTSNAPRKVINRKDGRLMRLLIKDGELVKSDQIIAYSESTADHKQVIELEREMKFLETIVSQGKWELIADLTSYTQLGELQEDFQIFDQKFIEIKFFLEGGFHLSKRSLLVKDLADLKELERILTEQLELQKQDSNLAMNEFNIQERLYSNKVIPTLEFNREKAKLLSREMPIKFQATSLVQNRLLQTAKQKELLELDNGVHEAKSSFLQSLQSLQSKLAKWKQQHILTAPVEGNVSYSGPWQEQEYIPAGTELMSIEPEHRGLRGIVRIPQSNFGKLAKGQSVLIKLDGFPYKEFGMIDGTLSGYSAIPGVDSMYWGYITLPEQLSTRYGKSIPYRNGLKGQAEIVTADKRLAERLLSAVSNGGQ